MCLSFVFRGERRKGEISYCSRLIFRGAIRTHLVSIYWFLCRGAVSQEVKPRPPSIFGKEHRLGCARVQYGRNGFAQRHPYETELR